MFLLLLPIGLHLCHWVPSSVPGKQARCSAIGAHALSGGRGERLLPWSLPAPGGYGPAVPSVRGPSGITQTEPGSTGLPELRSSVVVA